MIGRDRVARVPRSALRPHVSAGAPRSAGPFACCGSSVSSSPTPTGSTPRWPPTRSASCPVHRPERPDASRRRRRAGLLPRCVRGRRGDLPGTGRRCRGASGLGEVARRTVVGSGMRLPFRDGAVDVCYSSNVLEHVPDPWVMVDEMLRVTRPVAPSSSATRSGTDRGAGTRRPRGTTSAGRAPGAGTGAGTGASRRTGTASPCSPSRCAPAGLGAEPTCGGRPRPGGPLQPLVVAVAAPRAAAA